LDISKFKEEKSEIEEKKGIYLNLITLEDDISDFKKQILEIKMQLKIKEAVVAKIKKLEQDLRKGESIEILKHKLEKKNNELKRLIEEKEKISNHLKQIKVNNNNIVEKQQLFENQVDSLIQKNKQLLVNINQTIENDNSILSIIKFNETQIISCDFFDIKLWCLSKGVCLKTFNDRSYYNIKYIKSLAKINITQFASTFCKTIKIWDISSENHLKSLSGHDDTVQIIIKLNTF